MNGAAALQQAWVIAHREAEQAIQDLQPHGYTPTQTDNNLACAWTLLFQLAPEHTQQLTDTLRNVTAHDADQQPWWRILTQQPAAAHQLAALLSATTAQHQTEQQTATRQAAEEQRLLQAKAEAAAEAARAEQARREAAEQPLRRELSRLRSTKYESKTYLWLLFWPGALPGCGLIISGLASHNPSTDSNGSAPQLEGGLIIVGCVLMVVLIIAFIRGATAKRIRTLEQRLAHSQR
jgi:hypothetical protein